MISRARSGTREGPRNEKEKTMGRNQTTTMRGKKGRITLEAFQEYLSRVNNKADEGFFRRAVIWRAA